MALRIWRKPGESVMIRRAGTTGVEDLIRIKFCNHDPIGNRGQIEVRANPKYTIYREEEPRGDFNKAGGRNDGWDK